MFLYIFLRKKNVLIISRSIISSLFLGLLKRNNILELHHKLSGFTKVFFYIVNIDFIKKNIIFIFLNKKLYKDIKVTNIKYQILDDAVNIENFRSIKSNKIYKKTCVYSGGFTKGKGVENIIKLAKLDSNIKYHLYGDINNSFISIDEIKKYKNIKYKGYVEYYRIPSILSRYDVLLMPYSRQVYVRSNNLEISNYMSPLKLFEYLASKKIIIASNLKVYKHILNKKNSILLNVKKPQDWIKIIHSIFENKNKYNILRYNAFNTALKFTWKIRASKIINFYNKHFYNNQHI